MSAGIDKDCTCWTWALIPAGFWPRWHPKSTPMLVSIITISNATLRSGTRSPTRSPAMNRWRDFPCRDGAPAHRGCYACHRRGSACGPPAVHTVASLEASADRNRRTQASGRNPSGVLPLLAGCCCGLRCFLVSWQAKRRVDLWHRSVRSQADFQTGAFANINSPDDLMRCGRNSALKLLPGVACSAHASFNLQ